jgi:hypothetical protein
MKLEFKIDDKVPLRNIKDIKRLVERRIKDAEDRYAKEEPILAYLKTKYEHITEVTVWKGTLDCTFDMCTDGENEAKDLVRRIIDKRNYGRLEYDEENDDNGYSEITVETDCLSSLEDVKTLFEESNWEIILTHLGIAGHLPLGDIEYSTKLNEPEIKVAIGWLIRYKWACIDKGFLCITKEGRKKYGEIK